MFTEPEPASIDADTVANMIRTERDLWLRHCPPDTPGFRLVMEALDSMTARLATQLDPETYVEFFKRCGHTGIAEPNGEHA